MPATQWTRTVPKDDGKKHSFFRANQVHILLDVLKAGRTE